MRSLQLFALLTAAVTLASPVAAAPKSTSKKTTSTKTSSSIKSSSTKTSSTKSSIDLPSLISYLKTAGPAFCTSFNHYVPPTTTKLVTETPAPTSITEFSTIYVTSTITTTTTETVTVGAGAANKRALDKRTEPTPSGCAGLASSIISTVCSFVATGKVTTTATSTAATATVTVSALLTSTILETTTVIETSTTTSVAPACSTSSLRESLPDADQPLTAFDFPLPFPIVWFDYDYGTTCSVQTNGVIYKYRTVAPRIAALNNRNNLVAAGSDDYVRVYTCGVEGTRSYEFDFQLTYRGDTPVVNRVSVVYREDQPNIILWRFYNVDAFTTANPATFAVEASYQTTDYLYTEPVSSGQSVMLDTLTGIFTRGPL
ncbi:hypothetical protein K402DRAFT_393016 [Aulographum hederae CBS 113979]|uniref:Uncharacterized protein n=1 Tax=Aulographum hederae CBS 113979 TaxID=1176131 RepID=A0A6G1H2N0_9PEZI|nr:hypothetical protein K402DRAFT_393016 [Aulographum hederae CBS 113979]